MPLVPPTAFTLHGSGQRGLSEGLGLQQIVQGSGKPGAVSHAAEEAGEWTKVRKRGERKTPGEKKSSIRFVKGTIYKSVTYFTRPGFTD